MPQDWMFHVENGACHFRCGGLLVREGRVLLQRENNVYALPGGHVQFGETGGEAVEREFQEELEAPIRCLKMLWSEESFWAWNGKQMHTLSFYYQLELMDEHALPYKDVFWPMKDNERVEMGWVPFETLKSLTVYPTFLKERIFDLQPGHFITRE